MVRGNVKNDLIIITKYEWWMVMVLIAEGGEHMTHIYCHHNVVRQAVLVTYIRIKCWFMFHSNLVCMSRIHNSQHSQKMQQISTPIELYNV